MTQSMKFSNVPTVNVLAVEQEARRLRAEAIRGGFVMIGTYLRRRFARQDSKVQAA